MTDKKVYKSKSSPYVKEYYKKNSQKWLRKVKCDACNTKVSLAALSRHKRTKKHMLNVNPNPTDEEKKFMDKSRYVKFRKCKLDDVIANMTIIQNNIKSLQESMTILTKRVKENDTTK